MQTISMAGDAIAYRPDKLFDTLPLSNTLHMIGEDDRTSPRWPTLLNLFQRIATPNGRNHAIGETTDWMMQAGFKDVKFVRFSLWNVSACLIGEKPTA